MNVQYLALGVVGGVAGSLLAKLLLDFGLPRPLLVIVCGLLLLLIVLA